MAENKFGKGISVVSGFDLGAAAPVDSKYTVATKAEMEAHKTGNRVYEGMQVFCEEDKTLYIYKNGNFVKLDQSTTVETTVSVSGDVNDTSFKVGAQATASVALALKNIIQAGTGCKVTVNEKGLVTKVEAIAVDDLPAIPHTKVTGLGDVATLNKGTASGNVVVVGTDGKIADSLIPKLAISNTYEVASEAEMLGLTAEEGDIAIRSDLPATFILKQAPATEKANWIKLATPTDAVLSVNGLTGTVVLGTDEVKEGSTNLYYTEARATANFDTNFTAKVTPEINKVKQEIKDAVDAIPKIEKIDFTSAQWGAAQNGIVKLTLANTTGKHVVSEVFKVNASGHTSVVCDFETAQDGIKIVSMDPFDGYVLVSALAALKQ